MSSKTQRQLIRGSIDKIEPFLAIDDFGEYCEAAATLEMYWRIVEKKTKENGDKQAGIN